MHLRFQRSSVDSIGPDESQLQEAATELLDDLRGNAGPAHWPHGPYHWQQVDCSVGLTDWESTIAALGMESYPQDADLLTASMDALPAAIASPAAIEVMDGPSRTAWSCGSTRYWQLVHTS